MEAEKAFLDVLVSDYQLTWRDFLDDDYMDSISWVAPDSGRHLFRSRYDVYITDYDFFVRKGDDVEFVDSTEDSYLWSHKGVTYAARRIR